MAGQQDWGNGGAIGGGGGGTVATSGNATQGGSGKWFNDKSGNWATGAWQSTSTKDGKPMWISPEGDTWLTPPPSDVVNNSQYLNSAPFQYSQGDFSSQGGTPARVGVDDRPWVNVMQPSAYEYGGAKGTDQFEEERYAGMARNADARQAPQLTDSPYGRQLSGDFAQDASSRGNQLYALTKAQDMIEGRAPSVAQAQQNMGLAQAMQQQASIANSARGGGANLAAAQQAAANAAGNLSGNAVQQNALLRAQEVQNATSMYSQGANALRGSDQARAQLSGQLATNQAGIDLQSRNANDSRALAEEQMRRGVFQDQMGARQAGEAANNGVYQANADRAQRADAASTAERDKLLGTGFTVGGALVGTMVAPGAGTAAGAAAGSAAAQGVTSDVRAKKDIGDGTPLVRAMMSSTQPYTYDYKNPGRDGAGQQVGVMAQDLEKGPLGAQVVKTGPDGQKVIDGRAGLGLALASGADHEQRMQALEAELAADKARRGQTAPGTAAVNADWKAQAAADLARREHPMSPLARAAEMKAQRDVELNQIDKDARAAATASLGNQSALTKAQEMERWQLDNEARMGAERNLQSNAGNMSALARARR